MNAPSVSYQGMSVPVPDLMNTPRSNEAMLRTDLTDSLPEHAYATMFDFSSSHHAPQGKTTMVNTPCSGETMLRTGSLPEHAYTTMLISGIAVQRSEGLTEALRA